MNEQKTTGDKTLHVDVKKKLTLKLKTDATVQQSFSHGRSKTVLVETKKKRILKPGETEHGHAAVPAPRVELKPRTEVKPATPPAAPTASEAPPAPQRSRTGVVLQTLSAGERAAREKALAEARIREEEDRKRRAEEERLRAIEEVRLAKERAEAEARRKS